MLDLAQGLVSWKAESKEESLCGTYKFYNSSQETTVLTRVLEETWALVFFLG